MQPDAKRSIHSLLLEHLEAHLATLNERPYRAKQIVDWLYEKRATAFEQMSDLPQTLRARLAKDFAQRYSGAGAGPSHSFREKHDVMCLFVGWVSPRNPPGVRLTGRLPVGCAD